MGLIHSPRIVTDGLILHLDAANVKSYPGSGTTWKNMAKDSYDFGLYNGPTYSTESNGYFEFDGIDDRFYGSMANFDYTKPSISFNVWAKFYNSNGRAEVILWKGTSLGRIWLYRSGTSITINSYFGSGKDFYLTIGSIITYGEWINIVATFNRNDKEKVYTNGTLRNYRDISTASSDNWQNINTLEGSVSFNANTYGVSGSIAYVSAYDRELSQDEITQNFSAIRGRFGL